MKSIGRAALLAALCWWGPEAAVAQGTERPRLVVFIVVDQMRSEMLDRFAPGWSGGFTRLSERGVVFPRARHDHAFTATAPGHAALMTGVHPSRSGIVANEWWDRLRRQRVYAVEDSSASVPGLPGAPGRSPDNLLRETVGDWLKAASPESKVYSVALKDRVAVLMAGRRADGAYWYDYQSGRYVTSSSYALEYPEWVTVFNDSGPVHDFAGRVWERLLPEDQYGVSREDAFAAEDDSVYSTFPHPVALGDSTRPGPYEELASTPFGDELTFAFARELIDREVLGADEVPDLLLLGASSSDLIGHRYGPYSQEIQDHFLRLDRFLDEFFRFLDDRVGEDAYEVVLTSDHGVATMPEEAVRRGIEARRVETPDFREALVAGITQAIVEVEVYGSPSLQLMYPNGLVVDFPETEMTEEQRRDLRRILAAALVKAEVIADAFTYDELLDGSIDDGDRPYLGMFRRSFHPDRATDVVLRFRENDVFPPVPPANHGSPYDYDAEVPLIFMGPALAAGRVDRRVRTVDVAPTVAALLGIGPPGDLDGVVIPEALGSGRP